MIWQDADHIEKMEIYAPLAQWSGVTIKSLAVLLRYNFQSTKQSPDHKHITAQYHLRKAQLMSLLGWLTISDLTEAWNENEPSNRGMNRA